MMLRASEAIKDQRVRFVIVGGWNTIVGYLIFAGVHFLFGARIGPFYEVILAYALALPLSFLTQKLFVFQAVREWLAPFCRFVVANSLVFAANLLFLPLAVKLSGFGVLPTQACFVLVSTIVSYLAHKHFSFRTGHE